MKDWCWYCKAKKSNVSILFLEQVFQVRDHSLVLLLAPGSVMDEKVKCSVMLRYGFSLWGLGKAVVIEVVLEFQLLLSTKDLIIITVSSQMEVIDFTLLEDVYGFI